MRMLNTRWTIRIALGFLVAIAGLHGGATRAEPAQRVYVLPQRAIASGDRPAILKGFCLDQEVIGAPTSDHTITHYSDPSAIVVHKLVDGRFTESQRWSDVLSGATQPWVEFRGASDVSRGVDLQVRVLKPEPKVSYEIEVAHGLATSRPDEELTADLLARIGRFRQPIEMIERQLGAVRAFSESSVLRRYYDAFAQGSVYWGIARETTPEQVQNLVDQFSRSVDAALGEVSRSTAR